MKLIRDKVTKNQNVVVLSGRALRYALGQKLIEEAIEVFDEMAKRKENLNKNNLLEEIGDLLEVYEAILNYLSEELKIDRNDIEEEVQILKEAKYNKKGGFSDKFMIIKGD